MTKFLSDWVRATALACAAPSLAGCLNQNLLQRWKNISDLGDTRVLTNLATPEFFKYKDQKLFPTSSNWHSKQFNVFSPPSPMAKLCHQLQSFHSTAKVKRRTPIESKWKIILSNFQICLHQASWFKTPLKISTSIGDLST